jgi:hypothetical protein
MFSSKYAVWGLMVLAVLLFYTILRLIFARGPRPGAVVVHSTPSRDVPPSLMCCIRAKKAPATYDRMGYGASMIGITMLQADILWLAVKGL